MQHVRRRVIAANAVAAHAVDRGLDLVAFGDLADANLALVHVTARLEVLRVVTSKIAPGAVVIVPVSPTWPPDSA